MSTSAAEVRQAFIERDGPVKLKCEACGGKSMTSVFLGPPTAIASE
ncbi:MAG: hypothetical protein NT015_01935 [Alphaproteobacteria bacterium]|nr:hypothetical protein [Alphaproteobacteria bacterium]